MTTKIPLQGLVSKVYLVHEWETASVGQQDAVLKVLGSKTTGHLRDLKQSAPTQATGVAKFQAARSSLEALASVLTVHQQTTQRVNQGVSVDICFTCSFEDAVVFPQAAVIKLLLAEHLQEQCSLLLCERLSKEEEVAAASSMSAGVSLTDRGGIMDDSTGVKAISANHSQRRRASRKKMLKQRRREDEIRAAQQTRFSSVLRELCEHFRRKQEEAIACVDKVLRDVIDTAIGDDQLTPGEWSIASERSAKDNVHPRQKRKKKRTKRKKSGTAEVAVGLGDSSNSSKGDRLSITSPQTPVKLGPLSTKPHSHRMSKEGDAGEHSAATAGSDSSPSQHGKPLLDCSSDSGSTHDDGPRLSFFSNVGSTGTTTSSISSASALPLPTFGSQSLYSSSTTTPFFLSLAPRDHHPQPSRAPRRGIDDDDDDHEGNQTCPEGPGSASHEPVASDTSNFEWYLPSVFSLQASVQRTISPTPALDWHFNHWQFKAPDGYISDKGASSTTAAVAELDPPPPPSSSSSTSSASSRFANARISGSTKKYSLASFSKIAGMDSSRRGSADHDKQGLTVASIREHGDGTANAADSDNESDFLYREGGFFDRQRALKRRRRPWPFEYAHEEDEEEVAEEHDPRKEGRSNVYGSPKRCFGASATRKGDTWTECVHCCKCACHRAASLRSKSEDSAEEGEADSDIHNDANNCEHQHAPAASNSPMKAAESGVVVKVTMALERITTLEEKLTEKTKVRARCERKRNILYCALISCSY